MDAPTDWTYGGLVNWTSADSLRLCPYAYALRPIIEAVKERCTVSGVSCPFSTYNPLATVKSIVDDIQSTITSLISEFANHTDNSGDWDGQTDIPDNWTEADILTAISAGSRLELSRLSPVSAEWVFQQYQILNLLRWVKEEPYIGFYDIYTRTGNSSSEANLATAISTAKTDWNSNSWSFFGSSASNIYNLSGASGSGSDYSAEFYNLKGKMRAENIAYSSINCDIDMYIYPYAGAGHTYNSTDGFTEEVYNLVQTLSNCSDQYNYSDELFTDIQADPTVDITYECIAYDKFAGTTLGKNNYFNILKYDITNGFNFQAPAE